MLTPFLATLRSLKDPYFWKVALLCLVLTAGLEALVVGAANLALAHAALFGNAALDHALQWLGTGAAAILAWFLAPLVFPLISSLFLDKVIARIEVRGYHQSAPRSIPLRRELLAALKFVVVSLLLNLLCLPLTMVFPPVYYVLNSYLYGREYFEMVSLRHAPIKQVRELRRQHRWRVMLAGLAIMLLFTVPFVNLLAPMLAAMFMVHVAYRMR